MVGDNCTRFLKFQSNSDSFGLFQLYILSLRLWLYGTLSPEMSSPYFRMYVPGYLSLLFVLVAILITHIVASDAILKLWKIYSGWDYLAGLAGNGGENIPETPAGEETQVFRRFNASGCFEDVF